MTELVVIDADTIIISAAAKEQKNRCLAKHLSTGREKLFMSKTEFNNWLKINPKWDKDEFEYEPSPVLVGEKHFAFHSINQKIDNIINACKAKNYLVCIEGEGNYRRDYQSKYVDYKGQRTAKPLLFEECREFVLKKYKKNLILAEGIETDDNVSILGWDAYKNNKDVIIAYCDKDIPANVPGKLFNYQKPDDGWYMNTPLDVAYKFATQMLTGDDVDNIPGIMQLSEITKSEYGIKNKGCGVKTAAKILKSCKSEKELAESVMECYKNAWEDDAYERMYDMGFFLWMKRHHEDEFCLTEYLSGWIG